MTSAEERNDLTAASEGAEAAEREKMLKNGQQTAEKDVEKEQSSAAKEPLGTSDRSALIGAVELERFRNDPFWKGLRVALFGGLALLFLGLVLTAVSIVVLRPKCAAPLPEFANQQALPSNGTTNTEKPNASSEPVFYDDHFQQPAPSYLMDDPLQKPTDPAASPVGIRPRVDSYIMIASAGEPVHFRCWQCQFQKCQNSQALHWRRVHSPEALPVERDEQSAFLIFQRVQLADAGVYECVDGTSRVASSPVHLRVEPPRTPVIHSLDQLVEENSQAFLRCSVPGHPEAQLSWRLENGVDARRLPGIVDDGRGTLRIEPVAEEHQRHGFVCWAVYPRRADKQALHAGPARIRLAKKEEEEPAAAGDGEVHPTAEEEEEAGEGKEAEAEEKPEDQKQQQQQQVDDQASGTPAEKEEPNRERNEKQQQPAEKEDPFGAEEEEDGQMLNKAEEMPQIPVENDQPTETDNAGQGQQTEAEEGSGEAMIQIEPLLNAVKAIAMESGEQQQQNGNGQQTEEEEGREYKSNGIRRKKRNV